VRPRARADLARASLLALAAMSLGGGLCAPEPGPDPCAIDPSACAPSVAWVVSACPDVDAAEALAVELGSGEQAFEPLAPDAPPEVHFGLQGGQHMFVSFRVEDARLDVYDRLRVTFWLAQGEACAPPDAALGHAPATCPIALGRRQTVLGSARFPLEVDDRGRVTRAGMVLFLSEPPQWGVPAVLALEVEDPCGREGTDALAWTPR